MVIGVTLAALGVSFAIYLGVGFILGRKTHGIADLLPLGFGRQARVANSAEFSASTVATTISLATVVLAFFEMAESFGVWLFWTVLTTSLGLFVVRLFARRIWRRMEAYDHRPTLHEFLGTEYNSEALSYVSAGCTSMGFLAAFAVELTVGSRFFGWLVPGVPTWIVVVVLSVVSFVYTAVGGFRAVIITDRIQMVSIWLLLLAMPVFYALFAMGHGGLAENWSKIPPEVWSFSPRAGLWSFLLGIVIINVPTFLSDMSIWQRIAGAQKDQTVIGGLWASVIGSAATWAAFVVLACLAFIVVPKPDERGLLVGVLDAIGRSGGFVSGLILFCIVLGLYGAMLSTASTQLIAVSHSLYEDLFSRRQGRALKDRLGSSPGTADLADDPGRGGRDLHAAGAVALAGRIQYRRPGVCHLWSPGGLVSSGHLCVVAGSQATQGHVGLGGVGRDGGIRHRLGQRPVWPADESHADGLSGAGVQSC